MEAQNNIMTQERAQENVVGDSDLAANKLPIKTQLRYDTAFSLLIAPLIATRYVWLALEKVNPLGIIKKLPSKISANFAAIGTGATFLSLIGVYSRNTLHDIYSIYSEAVGYELDKPKEAVTYKDIFMTSQNSAVSVTRNAFINRTTTRLATTVPFFVPWHKLGVNSKPYSANAEAGVGTVGVYLLGEGFLRTQSFFDLEQKLGSTAINHTDNKTMETIQTKDILKLLLLHRNQLDKNYEWPSAGTNAGTQDDLLAERISSLMNQTYQNTPNIEQAKFTIGKFNYLVGFELLDKPLLESLAFVELANKSKDMREVKIAAAAIENGQEPTQVFGQFGIDMNALVKPEKTQEKVIDDNFEAHQERFMSKIQQIIQDATKNPKTHTYSVTKSPEQQLGIA